MVLPDQIGKSACCFLTNKNGWLLVQIAIRKIIHAQRTGRGLLAAEVLAAEGGRGFNPCKKPAKGLQGFSPGAFLNE